MPGITPSRPGAALADLHAHTSRYSSCSWVSPEAAVCLAVQRGLNVLALTEHHKCWPEADLKRLRALAPELTVVSGMEITLAEGYDVVVLGTDLPREVLPYRTLAQLRRLLARQQAVFSFVAHPFRYSEELDLNLERVLDVVDGIEMASGNILRAGAVLAEGRYEPDCAAVYDHARHLWGLIPVYNSDSHREEAVGMLATQVPGPVRDMGELVAALRQGETAEAQDALRVKVYLDVWG